jgi:TPR repeat protein
MAALAVVYRRGRLTSSVAAVDARESVMSSRLVWAGLVFSLLTPILAQAAPAPIRTYEAEKLFLEAIDLYEGPKQLDETKARRLFEKAAAKGHAVAAGCAGWMTYHGEGGPMDRPGGLKTMAKALPGIRKRAEAGDGRAQELLGALLLDGLGVKQDEKEAFDWFSKAAAKGYASAMTWLGTAHTLGRGVKPDHKEAVKWLQKAAKEANPGAILWLGCAHAAGTGVKRDDKEAIKCYREAADRGHTHAMIALGRTYSWGLGVPADQKTALEWFRKAIDRGNVNAMYDLAESRLLDKDVKDAVAWHEKAVQNGYADSACRLGSLYEAGEGVQKDLAKALQWYRRAVALGEQGVAAKVKELERR